jgi:survival-of-motor-neuron-related-splicing factor 30
MLLRCGLWLTVNTVSAYRHRPASTTDREVPHEMMEQLAEYESQLIDVEALLRATPEDASLLSLRSDLLELINITKQSSSAQPRHPSTTSVDVFDKALQDAVGTSVGADTFDAAASTTTADVADISRNFADTVEEAAIAAAGMPAVTATGVSKEVPKKKSKSSNKEFEVPRHLIPLDTDSAAERSKKRRAIKALKSKWRESQKEAESAQKQKSWQSFQKKKKLKTNSMFSTTTAGDAAVGVVVAAKRRQNDA